MVVIGLIERAVVEPDSGVNKARGIGVKDMASGFGSSPELISVYKQWMPPESRSEPNGKIDGSCEVGEV
ncbi:uncharacterized protein N7479_003451 [Penicillium vulpinum]|uniref:uncharacterized protein n=1 Tax=Penicillium vulpinum TaxID=29845 RepID=UPI002547665E|nr:uncharacterized protein N7479_003451 [Penicillium vulpinum]KAJ5963575.1 hypothetical protein N7479_003451 [Penicillium vulpinum]